MAKDSLSVSDGPAASDSAWPLRRLRRRQATSNYAQAIHRISELEVERSDLKVALQSMQDRVSQLERIYILVDWQTIMNYAEKHQKGSHDAQTFDIATPVDSPRTTSLTPLPEINVMPDHFCKRAENEFMPEAIDLVARPLCGDTQKFVENAIAKAAQIVEDARADNPDRLTNSGLAASKVDEITGADNPDRVINSGLAVDTDVDGKHDDEAAPESSEKKMDADTDVDSVGTCMKDAEVKGMMKELLKEMRRVKEELG